MGIQKSHRAGVSGAAHLPSLQEKLAHWASRWQAAPCLAAPEKNVATGGGAPQSSSANLLFVGSGYLSQGELYKWGAIHTMACVLIYLLIGTPWLLLVAR